MSHLTTHTTLSTSIEHPQRPRAFRPWWRWLLTALAFPPSGYIAHLVAGRVDSVPAAALNGLIAGTGIGTAQWALLRRRNISPLWIAATALGLGTGLAAGAALVSYRTDISSLALMGAASGLAVGIAQGATLSTTRRALGWIAATTGLFALGWTITTAGGIDVSQQWAVFGLYGCTTLAFLQSMFVDGFVPTKVVAP
jgi:hypothetical protein